MQHKVSRESHLKLRLQASTWQPARTENKKNSSRLELRIKKWQPAIELANIKGEKKSKGIESCYKL